MIWEGVKFFLVFYLGDGVREFELLIKDFFDIKKSFIFRIVSYLVYRFGLVKIVLERLRCGRRIFFVNDSYIIEFFIKER